MILLKDKALKALFILKLECSTLRFCTGRSFIGLLFDYGLTFGDFKYILIGLYKLSVPKLPINNYNLLKGYFILSN